jgi:hypothetical protein
VRKSRKFCWEKTKTTTTTTTTTKLEKINKKSTPKVPN